MSESLQSNTTQTLPDDREELYHLVWREPAERITSLYSISKEQLTKRCAELRIPRPLAGYWKALAKGTAPAVPALPDLKSGKVEKFPRKTSQATPPPTKISSKVAVPAPRKRARTAGSGYALIDDLKTYLPVSSVTKDGYYKPTKKKLLDLNVSETGFNSAIDFLSRFFAALGKQGYWVRLAESGEGLHCQGIDIKEDPKEGGLRYDSLWRPCSASIICVGDVLFAFNLAEMTEYVPAKEINGRYIRDETMVRWMRGTHEKPFRYVIRHTLPTGRFLLQLYSPYSSTNWQVEFRQTKQCGLVSQIPKLISAIHDAVPLIKKQQEEARIKAEERRIQWELDEKRYREKERVRREKEAYNASLAELKAIMVQWAEDKRIEQFFREAESDASLFGEKQKEQVMERLRLARQLLSVDTAVERLAKWKTPEELLVINNNRIYLDFE
ncbi:MULTISPECIES: hypothetical protein [Salmonella]|uniref:Uncharacterized protein n=3 Tax=Salmonella enterica TaxID=28901 RepID=A0A762H8C7_SALER|nr:hypothetical protein [Salmonella enterica]EAA3223924.1 hypothetical protein [Salmonella enterica subsp. enterica serovar Newport]EAA7885093.1 hypothetical protein [Salmonella enterica subsp. enterica]EBV8521003.1 hypothetical protein [Salmonella enterica subsp. enterica serovar Larochelle]ECG1452913.1 hypothetical protein [Salmonella enterica subsp. enterica serovar Muenchen str. CFSAN000595]MCL9151618.1 hypothetical protein [Salmonella enterica subsp. enterica serovar Enteritidis]HAC64626